MPDSNWLVEVKAARRGSGFLIAPGLILTSWHVLKTEAGSRPSAVKVRILGNYRKGQHASRLDTDDADLVWPSLGYEPDSDHDFALLRLRGAGGRISGTETWIDLPRWGELKVTAVGFPSWAIRKGGYITGGIDESDTGTARGHVELADRLKALAAHDRGTFEIKINPDDQPKGVAAYAWPGMSGAAVFAGELLVGVVSVADEADLRHRLRALPISRLFQRSEVVAALKEVDLVPPRKARAKVFEDYGKDFETELMQAEKVVGRDWVKCELQEFCTSSAAGYFLVEAAAGLGKTALAALISRDLDAPAYFFSSSAGRTSFEGCLKHLAADLIDRFGLRYDNLPAKAGDDWDFVLKLLKAVTAALGDRRPLLLVIDAWDEVEHIYSVGLPNDLPAGAFVCVTGRVISPPLCRSGTAVKCLRIEVSDKRHQNDITEFLEERMQDGELRERLHKASEGNFLYLDFVLEDLASKSGLIDEKNLPQGLRQYYAHMWNGIKKAVQYPVDWETWDRLLRPVIALLAAAREPVSAIWLAQILERSPREVEERAISRWLRYLARRTDNGVLRYTVVHRSFAEFLDEELGADLVDAHAKIVARAFRRWGSLDKGLPTLEAVAGDGSDLTEEEEAYARRYVPTHLRLARNEERLLALLRCPTWHAMRLATDPSERALQRDWQELWAALRKRNIDNLSAGALAGHLGDELLCALAVSSIDSISGHLSADIITGLVATKVWNVSTALDAIKESPDQFSKDQALAAISGYLDVEQVKEALAFSSAFPWNAARPCLLRHLAQLGQHEFALTVAISSKPDAESGAEAVAALADLLPESLFPRAIEFVRSVVDRLPKNVLPNRPVRCLARLLRYAPREMLTVGDEVAKSLALDSGAVSVAVFLRRAQLDGWDAVRPAWESIQSPKLRGEILAVLLPSLPANVRTAEAERAFELLGGLAWCHDDEVLRNLLAVLPPRRLLEACQEVPDYAPLPLSMLADRFPQELLDEALSLAKAPERRTKYQLCQLLALVLLRQGKFDDAVQVVQSQARDSHDRGQALLGFMPFLAQKDPARAVAMATNFGQLSREYFIPGALVAAARDVGPEFLPQLEERAASLVGEDRRRALLGVAEGYACAGDARHALKLARVIGDDAAQVAFRCAVSLSWASAPGATQPGRAVDEALAIPDRDARMDTLKALAAELPVELATQACDAILVEPREGYARDWFRTRALRALLRRLCDLEHCNDAWSLVQQEAMDDTGLALRAMVAAQCADPEGENRLLDLLRQNPLPPHELYSRYYRLMALLPELRGRALFDVAEQLYSEVQAELTAVWSRDGYWGEVDHRLFEAIAAATVRLAEVGEVSSALDLALSSLNGFDLDKSLAALARYLNKRQAARAFSVVERLPLMERAVGELLARLAQLGVPSAALRRASRRPKPEDCLTALTAILPHLSLQLVQRAISIAARFRKKDTENAYENVLLAAIRRLVELGEPNEVLTNIVPLRSQENIGNALQALGEASELSAKTLDRALELATKCWERGIAYQGLLPLMIRRGDGKALRAFQLGAEVYDKKQREAVLRAISGAAKSLCAVELYEAWSAAMQIIARRSRPHVLSDLGAILPLVVRLGGQKALEGATGALEEVRTFWP